jgi:hypothetical protein
MTSHRYELRLCDPMPTKLLRRLRTTAVRGESETVLITHHIDQHRLASLLASMSAFGLEVRAFWRLTEGAIGSRYVVE